MIVTRDGLRLATERLFPLMLLVVAFFFVWRCSANIRGGTFGFDFEGTIWRAGNDILAGRSPYPAADVDALRAAGNPAVYPPLVLVLASPLSLLPLTLAATLWDVLSVAAFLLALRLVGLRDWRCYALLLLSFPMASSLVLGQLDCLLALACAVAWRYRSRAAVAGVAVGLAIAAKLLLWPLLVWLLATRRWRASAVAAATAVGTPVVSWAAIGFDGLREYPDLLSALSRAYDDRGSSLTAVALRLGAGDGFARAVPPAVALALLAAAVVLARRGDDRRAYALAIGAGIFGSPIVWLHYLVILYVPFALARPRLDRAWILPAVLWLAWMENPPDTKSLLVDAGLALALLAASVWPTPQRERTYRTEPLSAASAR